VSQFETRKMLIQRSTTLLLLACVSGCLLLVTTGCTGIRTAEERSAQESLSSIEVQYRPNSARAQLPELTANSSLADLLRYALLNQPEVEATYYAWVGSVRRITVERSLPDPRLTFESDIADIVMTIMPGLMFDLPGPGKLRAAAAVAGAESEMRYFQFETAVLQAAFNLKRAYYDLFFLEERINVNRKTLAILNELEKLARAQSEVAKATLQDVLRSQIEQERLQTEITNLEDSRSPLVAQFKAALGLYPTNANPPLPAQFESTPMQTTPDDLLKTALQKNPRLRAMEAEIRQADAAIRVAQRGRIPDFTLGLEVDVKPSPWIWRPQAGMTLPIWRDKIAAQIAAAQAGKRAAEARFSAEEIRLAVEFAERSFMLRESDRNLRLLQERVLPKARNSLEIAQAGYASARTSFIDLIDAERTLLEFEMAEVEAKARKEVALAELSLLIMGQAPAGAPVITDTRSFQSRIDTKKHE
jgi:cobalt-zinc-cadmium efflux system outer membrane protein